MNLLVGISGLARSGKDSLGAALVKDHGFEQRAFASLMKDMLYAINPLVETEDRQPFTCPGWHLQSVVDRLGWEGAKELPDIRRLLQRLGTEGGRNLFGQDFWVEQALKDIAPRTVFTDARFPNEGDAIHSLNGIVVRLHRPGIEAPNNHVSETAMDNFEFDLHIFNDGSREDLSDRADDIFQAALEVSQRSCTLEYSHTLSDLGATRDVLVSAEGGESTKRANAFQRKLRRAFPR